MQLPPNTDQLLLVGRLAKLNADNVCHNIRLGKVVKWKTYVDTGFKYLVRIGSGCSSTAVVELHSGALLHCGVSTQSICGSCNAFRRSSHQLETPPSQGRRELPPSVRDPPSLPPLPTQGSQHNGFILLFLEFAMLRWLISWGQCRRCHWSPQPSCVLQVLQVLLALWLPETAKQRQRAAVSVVQGHGQTGGKFQPDLQNQMKIYRTNTSERERKKRVLCACEGHGQAGWWVCVAGTVPLSCHSPTTAPLSLPC